jgi:hypothetical protein
MVHHHVYKIYVCSLPWTLKSILHHFSDMQPILSYHSLFFHSLHACQLKLCTHSLDHTCRVSDRRIRALWCCGQISRSDDNIVYWSVYCYITRALANELIDDMWGIKNKWILCVNLKIKILSCSNSVGKCWIHSRCENKNIPSNSTAVVQQCRCGATVQLWCKSIAVVQQYSCGATV